MIELTVKGKQAELKFNFKALADANARYSDMNNGVPMGNGAANLFLGLAQDEIESVAKVIDVAVPGKFTMDDLGAAVEELTEGGEKIDEVIAEFKAEMLKSGFFMKAINNQIKRTEEALVKLKGMENEEGAIMSLEKVLNVMKENI
ncbi:hypothetical protein ESZ50_05535 [Weissella muntiaci]|uniref:Phage tail protein n=1 Tax=Weissella muntiaci TaxID=2508881 RepID=A0A6C2C732_9LACO|nr:tail assembly chaperone [Weissella muntiaci]TYC49607.1 hypothetical protein ESZ50_05535 [Weissella muntiaci]